MMTRKHFEAIAHVLDANMADVSLVQDFADMLSEQNPNFDKQRFVAASTKKVLSQMEHEKYLLDVAHGRV